VWRPVFFSVLEQEPLTHSLVGMGCPVVVFVEWLENEMFQNQREESSACTCVRVGKKCVGTHINPRSSHIIRSAVREK
jgi:hypothetical protein